MKADDRNFSQQQITDVQPGGVFWCLTACLLAGVAIFGVVTYRDTLRRVEESQEMSRLNRAMNAGATLRAERACSHYRCRPGTSCVLTERGPDCLVSGTRR